MNTAKILTQARDLISNPLRYTTKELARDWDGYVVDPRDEEACAWCAQGAIYKVTAYGEGRAAFVKLHRKSRCLFAMSVSEVNDRLGHSAIMRLFDHAIRDVRAEKTAS